MSVAFKDAVVVFFLLVLSAGKGIAQTYLKRGEVNVISFQTLNGKHVAIVTGVDDKYIVYRFGTDKKIELEYPSPKDSTTWKKMFFNWHMHPSMGEDDGVDYDCLSFVKDKFRYAIYESRSGNSVNLGVKVMDLNDRVIADFPGIESTRKGTLMNLRNNENLGQGGEY